LVFGSATERGSGAARRAMGFLTRWLAGKMEDPAKRQADFEKHMRRRWRSARRCELPAAPITASSNVFPAYRPTPRVSSAPSARPIPRPLTHRL